MATAQETINSALRLIGVKAIGETPTAAESAQALEVLNQMLSAWKGRGVDLGHEDMDANDDIPVDDEHRSAVRYSLAVELASEYQAPLSGDIVALADRYFLAMQAYYCDPPEMEYDNMLDPYYSPNRYYTT